MQDLLELNQPLLNLKQSGIRARTKLCNQIGGINLGQGVCDLPIDPIIKDAAAKAIREDNNMYSPHQGIDSLKQAIIKKAKYYNKIDINEEQVLVANGATGAYVTAIRALTVPGDEAILIEPFYGYHKQILELHGIAIKSITLDFETNYQLDIAQLRSKITNKTKLIVLCNPANPSGKVFKENELVEIAKLATEMGLFIITDEIYEYIIYEPNQHISIASNKEYFDIIITISGLSKTYHMTGWRLGYAIGRQDILHKMGLIHDLLYICPPTPLQVAAVTALTMNQDYYQALKNTFTLNRDCLVAGLRDLNFDVKIPEGSYYLLANYKRLGFSAASEDFADKLLYKAGVSTVPGKYFYTNEADSSYKIRFCFAIDNRYIVKALLQMKKFLSEEGG